MIEWEIFNNKDQEKQAKELTVFLFPLYLSFLSPDERGGEGEKNISETICDQVTCEVSTDADRDFRFA
jgi:hypothetical protein